MLMLLKAGADAMAKDSAGKEALDCAQDNKEQKSSEAIGMQNAVAHPTLPVEPPCRQQDRRPAFDLPIAHGAYHGISKALQ